MVEDVIKHKKWSELNSKEDMLQSIDECYSNIALFNCWMMEDNADTISLEQGIAAETDMIQQYNRELYMMTNPLEADNDPKFVTFCEQQDLKHKREVEENKLLKEDPEVDKLFEDNHFWNADDLVKANVKPRYWYVSDMIADNCLSMIWGRAGSNKTWLMQNLAACMACGKVWLKRVLTNKTKVLYLDNEADDIEAHTRLKMVMKGMDLNEQETKDIKENFYYWNPGIALNEYKLIRAIRRKVKECGIKVVFVDSLIEFTSHDENSNRENSMFFAVLKRLQKEMGITFHIIHHQGKGSEIKKHDNDVGRGASQIVGCMRNVYELRVAKDNMLILHHSKSNICRLQDDIGVRVDMNEDSVSFETVEMGEVKVMKSISEELADKVKAWIEFNQLRKFKTKDVKANFPTQKGNQLTNALNILLEDGVIERPNQGSKGEYLVKDDDLIKR
jgi:RecA-family ATPase